MECVAPGPLGIGTPTLKVVCPNLLNAYPFSFLLIFPSAFSVLLTNSSLEEQYNSFL